MEGLARKLEKMEEISSTEKWTGYVWYSDQTHPEILKDENFKINTANNFIIEALLHNGNQKSIHIVHTHQYQITEYNLDLAKDLVKNKVEYVAGGRIQDKVKKLKFDQVWGPKINSNCEGLEVMEMECIIFKGLIF